MRRKSYVLTVRAEADLREARAWSRSRWGKELTSRYFIDLHEGAQYIADNHTSFGSRHQLAGGTSLFLHPVREHFIVYEPLTEKSIAVVAVFRQGRDIPTILQKWAASIRRELIEIRGKIGGGAIRISRQSASRPRRMR